MCHWLENNGSSFLFLRLRKPRVRAARGCDTSCSREAAHHHPAGWLPPSPPPTPPHWASVAAAMLQRQWTQEDKWWEKGQHHWPLGWAGHTGKPWFSVKSKHSCLLLFCSHHPGRPNWEPEVHSSCPIATRSLLNWLEKHTHVHVCVCVCVWLICLCRKILPLWEIWWLLIRLSVSLL
jgi:hypothetical protein